MFVPTIGQLQAAVQRIQGNLDLLNGYLETAATSAAATAEVVARSRSVRRKRKAVATVAVPEKPRETFRIGAAAR